MQLERQLNTKVQLMAEAKLVFLSFETKYLTPKDQTVYQSEAIKKLHLI